MSRFDNVGLWWEDAEAQRRGDGTAFYRQVDVPFTNWLPPKDLPNLKGAKVLGLDTETKDLELLTRGPGAVRGASTLVGVSVATEDRSWYFPLAHEHEIQRDFNMDKATVLAWLRELLAQPIPVVGANLLYDLEQLRAEGVEVAGPLYDVQYAEPLLDEDSRSGYSLDALGKKYLGTGKETSLLYKWCAESFGGEASGSQRKNIWRAPPTLVGPYAEADALLPLRILALQRPRLAEESLTELFKIECGLIPLLLDMRFRGVRVDVDKAQRVAEWLRAEAAKAQLELPGVDVWSSDSLARAFDKVHVDYLRTAAGNPSFTKPWLEMCTHPLAESVLKVRQYEKAANPFVEHYILGAHNNGRLHCQFNALRGDEYGTVSGRFSSSNPNLQNIPSRNKILGPLLRSLFIPEEGCDWQRGDYSQIEYRLLVHYAKGVRSDFLRERYRNDSTTDFHALTIDMVREHTGIELERTPAKNINFGLVYGMGKEKLIASLGVSADVGSRLYEAYFEALPAVRTTYQSAQRLARRGYVRTILGRRRRFKGDDAPVHKALNAVLQGGAADVLKKAMLECYTAGVFKVTGTPHLTVHDELDWSREGSAMGDEAFAEAQRIMENCVPAITVPLRVDMVRGKNWGECK